MPNVAGGSAIMDTDAAGITANYEINDNISVTAMWVRPINDNWDGKKYYNGVLDYDRQAYPGKLPGQHKICSASWCP